MKRLLGLLIVVAVVGAGAVIVWRTQSACTANHLPDKIGMFQRGGQTLTAANQLPTRTGWPQNRPAVVVDLAGDGSCPDYVADQTDLPMVIWLKVSGDLYVGYGRGGGP